MVYQDLSLVPSMSVLQNIFLVNHPCQNLGILNDRKAKIFGKNILDRIGLTHIELHTPVEKLSAGEAQLLEIAKAIASNPEVIIFDEPTASLSDIEISKLFEVIHTLKEQGISIIYITHYLDDVMNLCDRVTVLRNGYVISTMSISQTSMSQIILDMLGKDKIDSTTSKKVGNSSTVQEPLLRVIDACTESVEHISLSVYPGDIIGIAGLLGSGRTELLNMVYGLDPMVSGEIYINNKKVHIRTTAQAKACGIALVPEERRSQGLVLDFSVAENIAIPNLQQMLKKYLLSSKKIASLAKYMIQTLLIQTTGKDQVVRYLSGGNQQKVVIAKSLASNPKILLLDDPTFGVDIYAKDEIMKIIYDYVQKGNAVLFVSSEFSEITSFCNRTYVLKKGKIVHHVENNDIEEDELVKLVQ